LAAIKPFRIMFAAHFNMSFAPAMPVLMRQTASAVQFISRVKPFIRTRTPTI
jgi:hypothetical protein